MSRKPILHPVYLLLTLIILLRELNKIINIKKHCERRAYCILFHLFFLLSQFYVLLTLNAIYFNKFW
jgi:hypothetical protein